MSCWALLTAYYSATATAGAGAATGSWYDLRAGAYSGAGGAAIEG